MPISMKLSSFLNMYNIMKMSQKPIIVMISILEVRNKRPGEVQ